MTHCSEYRLAADNDKNESCEVNGNHQIQGRADFPEKCHGGDGVKKIFSQLNWWHFSRQSCARRPANNVIRHISLHHTAQLLER
jgi:hypothetical protein